MELKEGNFIEQDIFTEKVKSIKASYDTEEKKIIVSHVGELEQGKINTLSALVEAQLEFLKVNKVTTKKIFNIVIELSQNINLHGGSMVTGNFLNYLFVGKSGNEFMIFAGNVISNNIKKSLEERLKRIQSLSNFELKQQYMDVLTNGTLSEKGGAGLGFLTMALKAHSINFEFLTLNNEYSLFSIQLKVLK